MRSLTICSVLFSCCSLLPSFPCATGEEPESVDREIGFVLQIRSTTSSELFGKKGNSEGTENLRYLLKQKGREVTVLFEEIAIQRSDLSVHMTRDKFTDRMKGQVFERTADSTPMDIKTILHDTLNTPICKLELDDKGGEVRRTVLAGPGAKSLLERGLLAHALFFHVRSPLGKDVWQADNEIGLGKGIFAKGKLTYEKVKEQPTGGQVKVKVAGQIPYTGTGFISRATLGIRGEQTYDLLSHRWIAGEMDITIISHYELEGRAIGFVKNRLKMTTTALSAAKKTKEPC